MFCSLQTAIAQPMSAGIAIIASGIKLLHSIRAGYWRKNMTDSTTSKANQMWFHSIVVYSKKNRPRVGVLCEKVVLRDIRVNILLRQMLFPAEMSQLAEL